MRIVITIAFACVLMMAAATPPSPTAPPAASCKDGKGRPITCPKPPPPPPRPNAKCKDPVTGKTVTCASLPRTAP